MTTQHITPEQIEHAIKMSTVADGIVDFSYIFDVTYGDGNEIHSYWIWLEYIDLDKNSTRIPGVNTREAICKLFDDGFYYVAANCRKPPSEQGGEMIEHIKSHPLRTQNHCTQYIIQPQGAEGTQINLIFSNRNASSAVVCTNDEYPDWLTKVVAI